MNLEIREATAAERDNWDALIRRFPRVRVEHTRAWLDSLVATGLGDPLYLLWTVDGEIVGCMPGLLRKAGPFRMFGSPLPGWQTGGMGPLFDPARVTTSQLISALIPALEERYGVAHVELLTAQLDGAAMAGLGFRAEETPTWRAPLYPGDEAKQLALFKDSARRNIKRAHKLGLEVRFETDESFVEPHYRQLCDVYVRGGHTISFSLERTRLAFRHLKQANALIAASVWLPDGKTMIASGMFAVEGKELLLWSWAHSTRYRWYRATELLTWSIMTRAMARGCETFDLMGLGDFKAKFGASLDCTKTRWVRSRSAAITRLRDMAGRAYVWQQKLRGKLQRRAAPRDEPTVALVLGDVDLLRAASLAGIPCAVMAGFGEPERYSRLARTVLPDVDSWEHPEQLSERIREFGWSQPEPPVLFYHTDGQLRLLSKNRDRIGQACRFVVPDARLVEDLVDRERFQALATRLKLPVPPACVLRPAEQAVPASLGVAYPVILKPLNRRTASWYRLSGDARVIEVRSAAELQDLWPRLAACGMPVLAQQRVGGFETSVESYVSYVDAQGQVAAEFTGRELRAWPMGVGFSTAIETTDAPDVLALGRSVVSRLKLRGVAKVDLKRGPDGQMYLLGVNARFQGWHHLGARAGVNIPAIVYADLTGTERPTAVTARAGVRWCKPWKDLRAARATGLPLLPWAAWVLGAEVKRGLALDDPWAMLGAAGWRLKRKLHLAPATPTPQSVEA